MRNKERILMVDDDFLPSQYYVQALQDAGFDVAFFSDVDKAIEAANLSQFNAAIIDLMIPAGHILSAEETHGGYRTGVSLARRLRTLHPHTRFVILTNAAEEPDVRQWCDAHDVKYLRKSSVGPIELARLGQKERCH